jgi:hypothetical protein
LLLTPVVIPALWEAEIERWHSSAGGQPGQCIKSLSQNKKQEVGRKDREKEYSLKKKKSLSF